MGAATRHLLAGLLLAAAPNGCSDSDPAVAPSADARADAATADVASADVAPPATVRVLSYNVGNPDGDDPNTPYRNGLQAYEDHIGAQIRALRPDIVALQEVLPPHYCAAFDEADPAGACYDHANRPPAARRLLGDDYSIVCDDRLQFECVGVHVDFATIDGVPRGGLELMGAPAAPLPLAMCSYVAATCDEDKCDEEAVLASLTVSAPWGGAKVQLLHLNASGYTADGTFYLGTACREAQLVDAFASADGARNLLLGDFNLDPASLFYEAESLVWAQHVSDAGPLYDHGELEADGDRVETITTGVAIDHVLSDFLTGRCVVQDDPVLDAGFDFSGLPDGEAFAGRIDHRAVLCDLSWR